MSKYYDDYFCQKQRDISSLNFSITKIEIDIAQTKTIAECFIKDLRISDETALSIAINLDDKRRSEVYRQIMLKEVEE